VSTVELHCEQESYRAVITLRTPEGETATVIVMRRGRGQAGRVWLTFNGALKTIVVMNDQEAGQMTDAIDAARKPPPPASS
jgi:hypothetical protein